MRRVALVTVHYLRSKRRAGFHFLAHAYKNLGWEVLFITVAASPLAFFKRGARGGNPLFREAHQMIETEERLFSYVWYQPFHPVNLRNEFLNSLSAPFFKTYGRLPLGSVLKNFLHSTELVIFESTAALLLFDSIKHVANSARHVYRVSDDVGAMGCHPLVRATEKLVAPKFDLISVPSPVLANKFGGLSNVEVAAHGFDTKAFSSDVSSPYDQKQRNLLYIGSTLYDPSFIRLTAPKFPDLYFHIVGDVDDVPKLPNVIVHGELPFLKTIPFVRHADVGLALYEFRSGAGYLAHSSLKMMQFNYCKIPTVAPDFIGADDGAGVFSYVRGNPKSMAAALVAALAHDRTTIRLREVLSWEELGLVIAGPNR